MTILRRIARVCAAITGVLCVAVACTLAFIDTRAGHALVCRLVNAHLPIVHVGAIDGSLYRDFTLSNVAFDDIVRADHLRVRYDLNALFHRQLVVEHVAIDGASVHIALSGGGDPASAPASDDGSGSLELPITIILRDAALTNTMVSVDDGHQELLRMTDASAALSGALEGGTITAALAGLTGELSAQGQHARVDLSGTGAYGERIDGAVVLSLNRELTLHLSAEGPETDVLVELGLSGAASLHAIGELDLPLLGFAAAVHVDKLDPHAIVPALPSASVTASGIVTPSSLLAHLTLHANLDTCAIVGHEARFVGDLDAHIDTDAAAPLDLRLAARPIAFDEFVARTVDLRAGADRTSAWVHGRVVPVDGAPIDLDVALPVTVSLAPTLDERGPWHASVQARRFPFSWLRRFVDAPLPNGSLDLDVRAAHGKASVGADVRLGERHVLRLDAAAKLTLAALLHPAALMRDELSVHAVIDRMDSAWLMKTLALPALPLNGALAADLRLTGSVPKPHLTAAVSFADLGLRLDMVSDSVIRAHADLTLATKPLLTVHAGLATSVPALLDGRSIMTTPLHADADLHATDLSALGRFADPFNAATGALTAAARATGTIAAPSATATARITTATFAGVALGDVDASVRYADNLHATVHAPAFARGAIAADVTYAKSVLSGRADVTHVDVAPFATLIPSVRRLSGALDVHATVEGSKITGNVVLAHGGGDAWRLPPLSDVTLAADIGHDRVTLQKLAAKIGRDGTLSANGHVELAGFTPKRGVLAASVKTTPLPVRGMSDVRFTGDLSAALETDGGMHVRATLKHGLVDLPTLEAPKATRSSGPLEGVHVVGEQTVKQSAAPAQPISVTLKVEPLRVRGKDVDLEVQSALDLTIGDDTKLGGSVDAENGSVSLFNRRWDLQRASLRFNGRSDINPGVDVTLTRQFPDAFVTVRVQGTIGKPELVLSSDPPLERAQIVALIITGSSGGKATEAGTAIAAAALTTLLGGFTQALTSKIGIDVMRMDVDSSGPKLEIGKYIGQRLYVGYRRLIGAGGDDRNGNELRLEYRLTPRIMVESGFGDAGIGGVDLVWSYRY